MEKTFIDWYLIEMSQEPSADSAYLSKMMRYLSHLGETDFLNVFENCLLVEVSLKRGTDA